MTASPYKLLSVATVLLTLMTTNISQAQEADSNSAKRSFEPDYFSQYAPQSAFDMIRRVPGFQLRGGNNARGLGQGGANVLVNGQQITGKGGDPFDQVDRIPAANVVRIEIVDGTSLDIPGLSGQVANIVTQATAGISGSWEWNPEWRHRQEANLLRGNVKASGETGDLTWAAELRNGARRNGDYGPETRRNADGSIYEIRQYKGRYNNDAPSASVNLTWKPTDDRIGNLNLEYTQLNFHRNSGYQRAAITDRGRGGAERFHFSEDEWNAKIDGDYEFPFIDGKLKLIGYYRAEHSPTSARFFDYNDNYGLIEQTEYNQIADEGEAIARTEYSWSPKDGRDWQISVEGAYNFLDIENQFLDILDASNSGDLNTLNIEENRAEGFLTHTRKLNDKWSVQASIGAEYSELTAGGLTRKFTRPKGSFTATYKPDDSLTLTGQLARQIGQLNFFDFSSSVSLQDDVSGQGTNFNLVPDQAWWGELALNKTFKGGHTFEIQAHGRLVSDIVDRIPLNIPALDTNGNIVTDVNGDVVIADYTTGVGNIGSGEQGGVHFSGTIKGDNFGLKGMELKGGIAWHRSSVIDPITFEKRQFSGQHISDWNVNFRHDIPKSNWSWGFYMESSERGTNYNPFELSRFDQKPGWNEIFIEHKDVLGMKVQLELGTVIENYNQLDRIIFTDRRDLTGTSIDRIENRRREYDGPYLTLTVSDTF